MRAEHSFFLPDREYCVDTKGMVGYLGAKVSRGFICLFCNGRGKQTGRFASMRAAQAHMRDRGHCNLLYEDEDEFGDLGEYERWVLRF